MRPVKSTNGRTKNAPPVSLRMARTAARALDAVSPRLAARFAAWLFFRTRRRPVPEAERAVLARAETSTVAFEGTRLAVWRWGRGPTVLLGHGWGGRGGQLHALVEPLVAAGHRVVAFDGPGHGASPGHSASLPELSRALATVARAHGSVRAIVSHSLGGPAAALAIADGLPVERLVLVAPPSDAASWLGALCDALELSVPARVLTRGAAEERAGVPIGRLNMGVIAEALWMPLLVVHDRGDREVPWSDGARIAALTGGTLLTTEGLGHHRILQDAGVIAAIREFVGTAPQRPSQLDRELFDRRLRWAQVAALGSA